jgi:hypothetical protein
MTRAEEAEWRAKWTAEGVPPFEQDEWLKRKRRANGAGRGRFPLVPFSDLRPSTASTYLVKGVLPRVGLGVVWGPPKCGKSFWFFDLLAHVALAWSYRGKRVKQGAIVYCAFEGAEGFKARAEAFRRKHKDRLGTQTSVPIYIMPMRLDLIRDHQALIASLREQLPADMIPAAVGLDTLNRSLAGSESSDEDVNAADALREAFNCFVGIVHHCGIDSSRPRGHTALTGAVDVQVAVKRDACDRVIVTVEYMKDGPEGETFASVLETVEVGTDDDGDAITSCVVVATEAPQDKRGASERKMPARHKLALDALTEALIDHGGPAPAMFKLPAGIKTVSLGHWREELLRRGVIERDAANPRQDFKRMREALAARGQIAERDMLVWLVQTP